MTVAPSAAFTDSHSASRTFSSSQAMRNHFVVYSSIGQVWEMFSLKA